MRKMVLLVLMLLPIGAEARPDTHALLAKQSDVVSMKKIDARTYRIEICPTNGCDAFESASSSLLDDYAYLYSVYVGRYSDFAASSQDAQVQPLAFIAEAEDKGYAKEILNSYVAPLNCSGSVDVPACVLEGLRKKGAIKHYAVNYDEGERTETPLPADAGPTAAYGVTPLMVHETTRLVATLPSMHPSGLAVEDPDGEWIYVVDRSFKYAYFEGFEDKSSFTFNATELKGICFSDDGRQSVRKVFRKAGKYEFYFADNLETEPENTFSLSYTVTYQP